MFPPPHTYQKPFSFFSRGYFAFKLELWLPPMMTKGSLLFFFLIIHLLLHFTGYFIVPR